MLALMKRALGVLVLTLLVAAPADAAPLAGSTTLVSGPSGALSPFAGLINASGLGSKYSGAEARTISCDSLRGRTVTVRRSRLLRRLKGPHVR